jgi:hypothetical protein
MVIAWIGIVTTWITMVTTGSRRGAGRRARIILGAEAVERRQVEQGVTGLEGGRDGD